jgi:hypothetical protein
MAGARTGDARLLSNAPERHMLLVPYHAKEEIPISKFVLISVGVA